MGHLDKGRAPKQSLLVRRSAFISPKVAGILVQVFESFSPDLAKTVYSIALQMESTAENSLAALAPAE